MIALILWYIAISLLGLLTFPVAYLLLPGLADRGYCLSRTLGLLLWGYIFWILASLGVLHNTIGGLLLALATLVGLSLWAMQRLRPAELRAWWQARRRLVIGAEILFALAYLGWAFVRSANPEIAGTEKPMELAFINAILHSVQFPPHDPWLSGYAISYYYFGYVMVAMLAKLTATEGSVAFNLAVALVFALSALGAYGVLYNLLCARQRKEVGQPEGSPPDSDRDLSLTALLGPFFLLLISNLEGFLHSLHNRGLFGRLVNGEWYAPFWKWLDMKELSLPPEPPLGWAPTRFWWWWRASRVIQDYDLAGGWREVIDEFPFFSYLLGDLHPHVLAMPFALLAIGLAVNIYLGGGRGRLHLLIQEVQISPLAFWSAALVTGGLAFLNTWDFPIYVALICGAYALARWPGAAIEINAEASRAANVGQQLSGRLLREFLLLGVALSICGIILYFPFYTGFSSQAGGLLPNLVYVTRGAHLWVMFGSLLVPLLAFLWYQWRLHWDAEAFLKGLLTALVLVLVLWFLAVLFGWAITRLPVLGQLFLETVGAPEAQGALLQAAFTRRLAAPGGWITLLIVLGLTLGLLFPKSGRGPGRAENARPAWVATSTPIPDGFILLVVLIGGLLVLTPEFFFLRDQFGTRMNTIFKFYYQAWILWSAAAAYGMIVLWRQLRGLVGMAFGAIMGVVILAALVYPVFSLASKTEGFAPAGGFTLDGGVSFARSAPDDYAAIDWLKKAPPGVVAEAVGGSYSPQGHGRVSIYSGQPTVLGWPGHESQWRGGGKEMGSRFADIERLYRTSNWEEARAILEQYQIRYVFVGGLERSTYRVNEIKFERFLMTVFQQGGATIYEVPAGMLDSQAAAGGRNAQP
jgi:YYY domain-containing protein